jgi:hypothetical protein
MFSFPFKVFPYLQQISRKFPKYTVGNKLIFYMVLLEKLQKAKVKVNSLFTRDKAVTGVYIYKSLILTSGTIRRWKVNFTIRLYIREKKKTPPTE